MHRTAKAIDGFHLAYEHRRPQGSCNGAVVLLHGCKPSTTPTEPRAKQPGSPA